MKVSRVGGGVHAARASNHYIQTRRGALARLTSRCTAVMAVALGGEQASKYSSVYRRQQFLSLCTWVCKVERDGDNTSERAGVRRVLLCCARQQAHDVVYYTKTQEEISLVHPVSFVYPGNDAGNLETCHLAMLRLQEEFECQRFDVSKYNFVVAKWRRLAFDSRQTSTILCTVYR